VVDQPVPLPKRLFWIGAGALGALFFLTPAGLHAATAVAPFPTALDGALKSISEPQRLSSVFETVAILTAISLIPTILIMTTCFLRFVIVFGLLRQALALQQTPPNHVLISLALVLTCFVMAPTIDEVNKAAIQPYRENTLKAAEVLPKAEAPVRKFLLRQTRKRELGFAVRMAKIETPKNENEVPFIVLVTAFVLSELKTGFQMGFLLFLPFLVIDLGVSSVLMSLGMMMVPPSMVALPLKILLFIMVDGWALIAQGLVQSVR
jgi:flagellar biosynthetic protein FliP